MSKPRPIIDIAAELIERGQSGRKAALTSETAMRVGAALITADARPERDAIALMICTRKCAAACYECRGRANIVVRAYGQGSVGIKQEQKR